MSATAGTFPAERTAIITGAVSERCIGRATVNYLAENGWNIGIIDLDDAACKSGRGPFLRHIRQRYQHQGSQSLLAVRR